MHMTFLYCPAITTYLLLHAKIAAVVIAVVHEFYEHNGSTFPLFLLPSTKPMLSPKS